MALKTRTLLRVKAIEVYGFDAARPFKAETLRNGRISIRFLCVLIRRIHLLIVALATESSRIRLLVCMLAIGHFIVSGLGMIAVVAHTFGVMLGINVLAVCHRKFLFAAPSFIDIF